jgi:hypothetical protein
MRGLRACRTRRLGAAIEVSRDRRLTLGRVIAGHLLLDLLDDRSDGGEYEDRDDVEQLPAAVARGQY